MKLTRQQREAVRAKYNLDNQGFKTYLQFRRSRVHQGWDCIMVQWCGMWVGIERDGYAHT
jgi:hypothetical protein